LKVVLVGNGIEAVLLQEVQRLCNALGRTRETNSVATSSFIWLISDVYVRGIHTPATGQTRLHLRVWLDNLPGGAGLVK
jgi:hypothetical protein